MKTLEERAKEYVRRLWKGYSTGEFGTFKKRSKLDFIAGANSERRNLLIWRDPKKELPEDSMRVIVCVQLPNKAKLITGGWHGTSPEDVGWHTDIDWKDMDVVGWRPIHEL